MSQFLHVRTMNKSIFYNIAEKAWKLFCSFSLQKNF